MTSEFRFVHLRVSSEYSLLRGAVKISNLPGLCRRFGMPAIAISDHNNMFGALEFSTGIAGAGIQPIHGCLASLRLSTVPDEVGGVPETAPVVLLAQDQAGYGNLLKLNTCLYLGEGRSSPWLAIDELRQHSDGLICLTGGSEGPVGRLVLESTMDRAGEMLLDLAEIFAGRLYVELQRHPTEGSELAQRQRRSEPELVELAYRHQLPLVATNDVHFPDRNDYDAHDAMLCIASGSYVDQKTGRTRLTPEHHFKSQEEMVELFEDLPEAVDNTIEIARRCSFRAVGRPPILPRFTDNEAEEMRRQANEGLDERLKSMTLSAPETEYRQRLDYELEVIESMGFAGYFLIVADFIKWAKSNDIPVGAGRGSGAGSLVAFALTITNLDPIRFSLLFERFLNPERISMPDFDIDFCQDRRDEVIHYVQQKYGNERVAHIITFGALLARAAIRDVGRVLRLPYSQVDRIAKLIPRDGARNVPLDEALQTEPRLGQLRESSELMGRLFHDAGALEGLLRNASTHAAGVVIGDRPLEELVPLYKDQRSDIPATQFSMKWVEEAGLVKFDFLGLKTLTVIRKAVDLLAAQGVEVDIDALEFDDRKTFELCASGDTVAVFQLESSGMKDTLRMMNPNSIEDIVALVALYRPGPMENIPLYCDVKNGRKKRRSQHKLIDHIVDETHGIIVYQEQVMQIAQAMAGYSLAEADLLRRAIGKKIKSDMDAEKPKFLERASDREVSEREANSVWDLLARFAEYGFNKAHAAAYAVVVYQTAWLKANHTVPFMTAVMNCDIGDVDKLQGFVQELRRLEIELVPPCVNRSEAEFSITDGRIHYGLGALKNVGVDAMRQLVAARDGGPFTSLADFAERADLKAIGKRQLETLARSGAFDQLESNRRRVFDGLDLLCAYSATIRAERQSAQMSLFGDASDQLPAPELPDPRDWTEQVRTREEFAAIGFYLSGHPLDEHAGQLKARRVVSIADLQDLANDKWKSFVIAGVVSAVRKRVSRRGDPFAFVEISDQTAITEITVFSEELSKAGSRLEANAMLLIVADARLEGGQLRLRASVIEFIENGTEAQAVGLRVYFDSTKAPLNVKTLLEDIAAGDLDPESGSVRFCPVAGSLAVDADIEIAGQFPVGRRVRNAIASLDGVVKVEEY